MDKWLEAIEKELRKGSLSARDAQELKYHLINNTDFSSTTFKEYWTDCWNNYIRIKREYML